MNNLKQYIQEKLHINKDTGKQIYTYQPEDRDELRLIITQRLEKDENADLNDIDVSKVNSFYDYDTETGLFEDLDPHNIHIEDWDVSEVKDMHGMFRGCFHFNCDLSKWNVRNVKNMFGMFRKCKNFKGNGLENWNTNNVDNMDYMFYDCESLENIPSWYKN